MADKLTISGCLIVKDEERFIGECLARLWKAVDEIVVVDTGSSDATVDLARSMGAHVHYHPWHGDFAEARNVALSYASHPWIFVVDADEYIDQTTLGHLSELADPAADGYVIDVVNFPDDDNNRAISKHLAIFRNTPLYRYEGAVHEVIAPSIRRSGGRIGHLPIRVKHYGYAPDIRATKKKGERNKAIIAVSLKKHPGDPIPQYYMAQEHYVSNELEEAVKYYRRALWGFGSSRAPFVPISVARLTLALWRLSRWDEAYEVLEQYQPRLFDYTDLHFLEGVLSKALGNYPRAEKALLKAIALGDSDPSRFELVHVGFGTYRAWTELGGLYLEVGRRQEAFGAFSSALRVNPRYALALRRLADLALRHDSPSDVLDYLSRVVDLSVETSARSAWEAFFTAKAWNQCDMLAQALPEDERELRIALTAIGRGHLGEARGSLLNLARRADHKEQKHSITTGMLVAAETGDKELAGQLFDLEDEENLNATLRDFATILSTEDYPPKFRPTGPSAQAKIECAWRLVAHAIELGLTTALERLGLLLSWYGESYGQRAFRLGKVLEQYGFLDAAAEQYLRAGLEGIYDAGSLFSLGRHATRGGYIEDAVTLLEKVIEDSSPGVLPHLLLARLLNRLGHLSRAEEILNEGRSRYPYAQLLVQEWRALKGSEAASDSSRE